MSGYAKLWTTMLSDEWFVGLSCNQRGFFMQLILLAKTWGDSGIFTVRSASALGTATGLDGKIARKYVGEMADAGAIKVRGQRGKFLTIELPNYQKWQEFRLRKGGKNPLAPTQHAGEKSPISIPNHTIPNHTKEEATAPPLERFNEWVKKNPAKIVAIVKALKRIEDWPPDVDQWAKDEIAKMRSWLIANPQKGNKKSWARFIQNWLSRDPKDSVVRPYPGYMTPQEEQEYYAGKRRDRGGDFSKIGDDI